MQLRRLHLLWILISCSAALVSGGKILLQPFAHCRNSHVLNFEKLAEILLRDKHEVYMMVPSGYQGPYSRSQLHQLHWVVFPVPDDLSQICSFTSLDAALTTPLFDVMTAFYSSTRRVCDVLFSNEALLKSLHQHNFDLAVYDAVDPCCRIMADYLNVPFIVFHTQGIENILPRHPAYMPSLLSSFTNQMTLKQRVLNTVSYMVQKTILHGIIYYYTGLKTKHQLNVSLSLADTYDRAALRFILGEYGLDYVGPTQPSHILIGGHLANRASTIDASILDFIDNGDFSEVLVVSLGSMIKDYGPYWRRLFAEALAQVPYQVIWRYNDDVLPPTLGNNTLLLPWLPQAEILSLPQTRVFVSHCGLNAVYEAATYGVPVVGVPLYGDQFYQANKVAKHAGIGTIISDIRNMRAETLFEAIMEVRAKQSFIENAASISEVLRNRPFSQEEQIRRWVKHVIQHRGARHLHSQPYYELPWYQYFLCDVFIILTSLVLFFACMYVIIVLKIVNCLHRHMSNVISSSFKHTSWTWLTVYQVDVYKTMKID